MNFFLIGIFLSFWLFVCITLSINCLRVWSICYVSAVPFRVTPSGCSGRLNRTVAVTDVRDFVGLTDSGQPREKSDHPVGQSWSDRSFQSQYVLAGFRITPFFILLFSIYRYSILTFCEFVFRVFLLEKIILLSLVLIIPNSHHCALPYCIFILVAKLRAYSRKSQFSSSFSL